jgi:heme oxygenase
MNLDHLRERTRPQHESTESLMPITTPGLTRAEYAVYLRGLHAALAPWERFAAAHPPPHLAQIVAERRRSALLEQDLRTLGAEIPAVAPFPLAAIPGLNAPAAADSTAAFLGAMYVVEGSSLGGQYIARHLESTLGLDATHGVAYFRGYGERTGSLWTQFKAVLAGLPEAQEDRVVAAAQAMFAWFAESLSAAKLSTRPVEYASLL